MDRQKEMKRLYDKFLAMFLAGIDGVGEGKINNVELVSIASGAMLQLLIEEGVLGKAELEGS